ncbi:hypothetical protein HRM2_12610 [Desulforapulum autotrophicum HRM2]|uniref:Uncharacterized protein n=1 Tax=Desulforapulum autotrophicum (strain ATCC 43914 / DSM 3382 / VKM B-1955 / HRM2) TaxID=177437 RepID=C0Q8N3_DESAH|nr:nucleoside recognition domain-containing protein [Desulforapulum autotrophicum]ACN14373.1 hypothetical protein HRM2_12610 [Desulforapulum autotrophicum HRM2]
MTSIFASIEYTASIVLPMGGVMFLSLFGIEFFMQMGLMKHLKPLGKPIAGFANLPSESAVSFLAAIGSMIAAHTMAAGFHADQRLTDRELILTGVLNTVPFHFKETLTFQLPVILPLLGLKLCLVYITAFWLTGFIKIGFVVLGGRFFISKRKQTRDAFSTFECDPLDPGCGPRPWKRLVSDTWNTRKKMFSRMMTTLTAVTLAIQLLTNFGMLKWFEQIIIPMTALFDLPPGVVGPISTYVFSPTVGITYMSNLLNQGTVTPFQAIVALLAGSLLMIPVTRLRRTLPRYTSIYGIRNGFSICAWTTFLSMLSRVMILTWVLVFF